MTTTSHKTMKIPIPVTGAIGRLGAVGRSIVEILRQRNLPVRMLVRREDERSDALRAIGAEVLVGDLTRVVDVIIRATWGPTWPKKSGNSSEPLFYPHCPPGTRQENS
jgi:nucleoside-diphosphate-sugar epimerase